MITNDGKIEGRNYEVNGRNGYSVIEYAHGSHTLESGISTKKQAVRWSNTLRETQTDCYSSLALAVLTGSSAYSEQLYLACINDGTTYYQTRKPLELKIEEFFELHLRDKTLESVVPQKTWTLFELLRNSMSMFRDYAEKHHDVLTEGKRTANITDLDFHVCAIKHIESRLAEFNVTRNLNRV